MLIIKVVTQFDFKKRPSVSLSVKTTYETEQASCVFTFAEKTYNSMGQS